MDAEKIDYDKLLAELLEERAGIDNMIAWVEKRVGRSANPDGQPSPTLPRSLEQPMRFPRTLAPDAFFRMNVPDAITAYLNIVKGPRSAKDITEALKQGGLITRAKDLYQTVFPTLTRMEKKGQIAKLNNGDWGLAEWYRGRRSAVEGAEE